MASFLRWTTIYWTLTQVVLFRVAVGDPVHIQLNLDGKENNHGTPPKTKYDALEEIPGLVKMWYNSDDPAKPEYNDPTQRDLIEKAGLKKLYIRGNFKIEVNDENRLFLWDNKRRGAKELGEFVLSIFKNDAIVIVVFPDDLQTCTGFRFQKEFEEVVQEKNDRITVGRGVINVYLGLGDQNQEKLVNTLLNSSDIKDSEKDEKYYSIFAKYHSHVFSFRTVFTEWRTELNPVNIFQVKIQEADSVVLNLTSVCTSDRNGFKVGSHTEQGLADILFKLLRVEDVKTHPEQRIRVELPEDCGTPQEREAFTGELVENLKKKKLKVYGKEPSVHIHIYTSDMKDDVNHIKKAHKKDIFGEINAKTITHNQDQNAISKAVSSAKELFIHIHCHGVLSNGAFTICGNDSDTLVNILFKFFETLLDKSVPKNAIITFHVCEAGSEKGQIYVNKFLTKLDKSLQKHRISIQESLSYKYETTQIKEHTQVMVPRAACDDKKTVNVHEKQVFGRFTVRTVKTTQGYKAFTVLPLTEYNLIYKQYTHIPSKSYIGRYLFFYPFCFCTSTVVLHMF